MCNLKSKYSLPIPFLMIMLALSCVSNNKKPQQAEKKTYHALQLSASLGGIVYQNNSQIMPIAITLYNPTNDTIFFRSMSCSYEDLFVIDDSTRFKIIPQECYKNIPVVVALPSKAKIDFCLQLKPAPGFVIGNNLAFKVGMYFLALTNRLFVSTDYSEALTIIWSDSLHTDRLARKIYY